MSSGRRPRRSDEGFTLLEILVAFTVAALLLGAGMQALSVNIGGVAQSRAETEAVLLANSAMEQVGIAVPLVETDRTEKMGGGFVGRLRITRADVEFKGEGPSLVVPYAVEVTVGWTMRGRERTFTLNSLRLAPLRQ
jgi:general secretion pathway protein I